MLFGALTTGAAATVAGKADAAPEPAQPEDVRAVRFEQTEHVRAYYRAARG